MILVLPLAIPWVAGVFLAALDGRRRGAGWLAVLSLAAGLVATVWLAVDVHRHGPIESVAGGWPGGVGIRLQADALGVLFAGLSLTVLLFALVFETLSGVRSRTFPACILLMATGLTGLFLTGDAFNFYVFFEIAMISAYVLTGYGERSRQLRAAMIFAVVNLLGSVLFLIAIAALYHVTGSLDMEEMRDRIPVVQENPAIITSAVLFVAFSVKLGLFPFHFWLPAVYTGTRPAVAAILSGALANIGSYGLLRFGADILPRELGLGAPALLILGSLSIVYGALQAVSRHVPGEALAYSAIGQVGYVLIALGLGGPVGYAAAILVTVVNSLGKTLLFLSANLRGWLVGAAFAVGALSVVGVPPAAGFLAKVALLRTSVSTATTPVQITMVALIVVGGALAFVYMFQIYQRAFWLAPENIDAPPSRAARRVVVVLLAALILALGLWPEPLLSLSEQAANVLPERGIP